MPEWRDVDLNVEEGLSPHGLSPHLHLGIDLQNVKEEGQFIQIEQWKPFQSSLHYLVFLQHGYLDKNIKRCKDKRIFERKAGFYANKFVSCIDTGVKF